MRIAIVALIGCSGTHPSPIANAATAATGCTAVAWHDDDTATTRSYEGRLEILELAIPNGKVEKPFVVVLDRPACLPANSEPGETSEIQIYSPDPAIRARIDSLVGARVAIAGQGFVAHTAHHHRPIVVTVERIDAR